MKYIRTKDNIFETSRLPLERFSIELTKMIDKQVGLPSPHIEEIEIIKQADTIEELCDEFVSITEDLAPEILVPKYISPKDTLEIAWKNRFEDEMCYKNVITFGAIWTDKGLIYRAKMKGILPNGEIDWELL